MTTHLVIADQDTIDKIADNADDLATDWDSDNYDYWHIETHDTWMFRTDSSVGPAAVVAADFVYRNWKWPVPDCVNPEAIYRLPLIAACDLLGVDEL